MMHTKSGGVACFPFSVSTTAKKRGLFSTSAFNVSASNALSCLQLIEYSNCVTCQQLSCVTYGDTSENILKIKIALCGRVY